MNNTAPNPMFAKFDQVLGKTTPTTVTGPVSSRADEIRNLAKSSQPTQPQSSFLTVDPALQAKNTQDVGNEVKGLGTDLQGRANNIADTFSKSMNSKMLSPTEALSSGTHIAAEAAGGIGDVFNRGFQAFNDLVSNSPELQKIASSQGVGKVLDYINNGIDEAHTEAQNNNPDREKINAFIQQHPQMASFIKDVGSTAMNLSAIEGGGKAGTLTKELGTQATNLAERGVTEAANVASDVVNVAKGKVSDVVQPVKDKITNMAVNSEKSGWQKPSDTSAPGYKKATAIYDSAFSKGHDISQTLVNNKIKLSDNIETGPSGKKIYNTSDTAERIHADAKKASNEMLRPALEKADASGTVPKTPVKDVIKGSVDNINASSMTAEAKEKMIKSLRQTQAALEKQYPDGMSLTDLHDEKINRDLNAKHSPVGDISTNMEATKNKAIADTARKMVEDKAPEGIPVHEFNAELAKQHQTANYLDALHGKAVPKSILSKIGGWTGKIAGAATGGMAGGGILGEIGGYHMGGILESMIENIPASMRSSILDNLKTSNPEVFEKVKGYLNNLDTKGSVAKPISNASINTTIEPKTTTFAPKSQTGKSLQSAFQKYQTIPNKQGGFVSIGGKTFREIPETTKKQMIQAIDYIRIGKSVAGIEDTISKLAQKYNISEDLSSQSISKKFEDLIENTKTK